MYSIFEAAEIIGRSTFVVNDWAMQHGIGKAKPGATYCMLYTHDEANRIAASLGKTLSDEIPTPKSNKAILDIPEGKLTAWQIRQMAGANWLPVVETGKDLGCGEHANVSCIEYSFTKKDLCDLAKAVGLPNPFKPKQDELTNPPIPVPSGFFTVNQVSELLGIPQGRTATMMQRSDVQQRDPTHPKRFLTTKEGIQKIAADEKMPDPFSVEGKKPLDSDGPIWTRFEVENRRVFVVLAHDSRLTTDDGEVFYSWWIWEIENEPKERCIVHGRDYKSRDDAIKVAAGALDLTVKQLLSNHVAEDRLDPLRAAVWGSGKSQNEIAIQAGTSARLLWRFTRGWNVREKLETAISDAIGVATV